jgi:hypothetical protein
MKVGLGALWLARGPQETSSARYDHVRDAVLLRASVPLQHGFGDSKYPNHAFASATAARLRRYVSAPASVLTF